MSGSYATHAIIADSATRCFNAFDMPTFDIQAGDFALLNNINTKITGGTRKTPCHRIMARHSGTRLKAFVERIERLTEEKKAIADDIKDCYSEAKATGFDAPTIRKLVSERKKSLEKRREQLELFELYSSAIGMAE